ncbi:MAG TPA: NAD-dependent epimerase/dehydratase family protein [Vicinamibacteria bacterium]|jgi:dihydroflavonol-4-reductase
MRVFVTGGNGFIGSVVVRMLASRGHHVRCLLRSTSRTRRLAGLDYETSYGDVRDPAAVRRGAQGCEAVIHLAGPSSWNDIASPLMRQVVVDGTRHVLDAAQESRARTIFVSSVIAINGTERPVVQDESTACTLDLRRYPYAAAKIEAEALCRAAATRGPAVVIVNPAEVYGPDDDTMVTAGNLRDFARSDPVLVCSGGTSIVHVEDVAAGILAALERGRSGERYILGGETLTVRALAEMVLELLGRKARVLVLPNRMIRALAAVGRATGLPLPFEPEVIPYATLYWFTDSARARSELGVEFRSARETLIPTLAWLRQAGHIP